MPAAIVAAVLGWIFALSGLAKIARPGESALALVNFRVIRRYHRMNGLILGAAECLLAIVVLVSLSNRILTVLSLFVLMAVFLVLARLVSLALARGESFACACFGTAGKTISARIQHRSVLLAAVAGVSGVVAAVQGVDISQPLLMLVLGGSLVSLGALTWQLPVLLRQNAEPIGSSSVETGLV